MEEKRIKISDLLSPEDVQEVLRSVSLMEEVRKTLEDDRDEIHRLLKEEHERWMDELQELIKNAPPGSLAHLMNLIAIIQNRSPEAGEAIFKLIERYFQRRRVLYITSERLRLEAMWKLELSPNEWGELKPLVYERDIAPLPLLEAVFGYKEVIKDPENEDKTIEITIPGVEDIGLGNIQSHIKKTMRNRIVRGGAQGRNIDIKEIKMEYRLKEYGDPGNAHEVPPNLSKWDTKEGFFKGPFKYRNPEYDLQYTTEASPAYRADPWDPREVVDITEEDRPLWEAISKAIPLLDDIDQALIKSIMYKIPITKLSKNTGIPEGTLRSRKSRLLTKLRKNMPVLEESATKQHSLSVS